MNRFRTLVSVLLLLVALPAICAGNAAQVLDKAVGKLKGSSSVECAFKVSGNSQSVTGNLKTAGQKFKLTTSAGTTWYDGKSMWTANPASKEITLVEPSQQEVRESNPFSYLDGYKSTFNIYFSRRKDASRHLVLLNPKTKSSEIKAVEIAINKKTYLPERFIIRDRNDRVTTIEITSLRLTGKSPEATFTCPVKQMKDYELVDLR